MIASGVHGICIGEFDERYGMHGTIEQVRRSAGPSRSKPVKLPLTPDNVAGSSPTNFAKHTKMYEVLCPQSHSKYVHICNLCSREVNSRHGCTDQQHTYSLSQTWNMLSSSSTPPTRRCATWSITLHLSFDISINLLTLAHTLILHQISPTWLTSLHTSPLHLLHARRFSMLSGPTWPRRKIRHTRL